MWRPTARSVPGIHLWQRSPDIRGTARTYAILKFAALLEAGVSSEDLRVVVVRDTARSEESRSRCRETRGRVARPRQPASVDACGHSARPLFAPAATRWLPAPGDTSTSRARQAKTPALPQWSLRARLRSKAHRKAAAGVSRTQSRHAPHQPLGRQTPVDPSEVSDLRQTFQQIAYFPCTTASFSQQAEIPFRRVIGGPAAWLRLGSANVMEFGPRSLGGSGTLGKATQLPFC